MQSKVGLASLTEDDDLLLCALGHGVAEVAAGDGEAGEGEARVPLAHRQLQVGGDVPPQRRRHRRRRVHVRAHALRHLKKWLEPRVVIEIY